MRRTAILGGIALAGVLAAVHLGLDPRSLVPSAEGWRMLGRFFAAAASPSLISQSDLGSDITDNIVLGIRNTVFIASAATSLSLLAGATLGVLASSRFWRLLSPPVPTAARLALLASMRTLIGLMRSIHELLWAVGLLAALGLHSAAAVIAIAIPYSGTLAKIFSELLDEAPDGTADALGAAGARPLQVFCFGLLPHTLPDVGAYAFYRFECALRSAAILGFFGYPTLGKFIHESVGELYFQEAWAYLYALVGLIVIVEWWSGALRQRLTAA